MDQGARVARRGCWASLARLSVFEIAEAFAFVLLITFNAKAQSMRAPVRIVQPIEMTRLVTLRGNTPTLARREYDQGAAPDDLFMGRMLLVLKRGPKQETALRQLLDEQQEKSSPHYHQWLTPEQFGQQFGPADADIQTISEWLSDQGFQIERVAAGRSAIEFSGTAGLVREAFHTGIHRFEVNGEAYWSNAEDPQIPAALSPVVAGIASLNNFPMHRMSRQIGTFLRSPSTGKVTPLFNFTSANGKTYHPLGPADFATIYNVQPLWSAGIDGTGESIAIVAESNINLDDAETFRAFFGLPAKPPQVILDGPDPGIIKGPESESDLDVEWAGAVAKNATIDLVVSESTDATAGIDLSALYIIDNNIAPVMSVSYGYCEALLGVAGNEFFDSLWEQAAAQGISVVVAAGDTGSAGCDFTGIETAVEKGLGVSGFASTPFDTAVGGTDFDDATDPSLYWSSTNNPALESSALSYIPESTWNDSCAQSGSDGCASGTSSTLDLLAGAGGPSTCGILTGTDPNAVCAKGYPKPTWQTGPGVPDDNVRDIPDVSLFAGLGHNGSFYMLCEADVLQAGLSSCRSSTASAVQVGGGTSTSAQTFAGIMALVNQKTGERQGDANYVLYKLAAQAGASCASNPDAVHNASCIFYDVVTGNNSLPCAQGSPDCGQAPTGGSGILMTPGSSTTPAWTAGPGYDLATGLGSVNAANLVNKWNSVSFTPTTTRLTLSPTTGLTHGQPVDVTIQVSAQSGAPTGDVSLMAEPNGSDLGIARFTLAGGAASGATTSLPGGTYNVKAHYAGDGNFGASDSSPIQVTEGKENSQTQVGIVSFALGGSLISKNAATVAYGSPYVLDVDVTNAAGNICAESQIPSSGCPTGTVTLTDNGGPLDLGTYTLNSLGQLEDQRIQLAAGSHRLVAAYEGDNSFNGSASSPDSVIVDKAATTTTLTTSSSSVQAGSSVTLTAVVNTQSNGAAPAGRVQFLLNGSSPVGGALSYSSAPGSPTATAQQDVSVSFLPTATSTITAVYPGDSNYSGSTSAPQTITLLSGFTLIVAPTSVTIAAAGQSGSSSILVTSGGGFNGTVTFGCQVPVTMKESACSINPPTLATSGQGTITITTTAPQTAAGLFGTPNWFAGCGAGVVICLFLFGIPATRRRYNWALTALTFVLLAAALVGCGGGNQNSGGGGSLPDPGTPPGTYVLTVTATSGSISHSANLSVTVQ